ncbi:hypothetical protein [Psychrobacter sp. WY6]|uniref:hypothetical protein n=1 Tax=Psychrobacter sp. WY6 TaxID=2708350 RepID=UPI0032E7F79D
MITEPALLLADEPTGNLDTVTAGEVFELFRKVNQERDCAVLLVTMIHACQHLAIARLIWLMVVLIVIV